MEKQFQESLTGALFMILWGVISTLLALYIYTQGQIEWGGQLKNFADTATTSIAIYKDSKPTFFWTIFAFWLLIGIWVGYRGVMSLKLYIEQRKESCK